MSAATSRRYPVGAEVQQDRGTHFRVWAPLPKEIALVIDRGGDRSDVALTAEGAGYYTVLAEGVGAGDRYWYRVEGDLLADPASRAQPDGPFGPSAVVDASTFRWSAVNPAMRPEGQVIYEMHVGTFTRQGTFRAAVERLDRLADVGVTVIEVMPIAEFPGRFGWGYDGVFPFAPARLYGTPDDFRAFVDAAHAHGLAVILDVVYNHFGPDGCVFRRYSPSYFAPVANEWGDGLNFDGRCSGPVREYFAANAAYWIDEFRLDGLRLDATQSIRDTSAEHIVRVAGQRAREAARGRRILLVAENEPQRTQLIRPIAEGGYGLDMLWNDDFHHSAIVALTGQRGAYYSDYRGTPQEFISAARHGFLFQGQRYAWQKQPRGTRTDGLPPWAFVNFIENHDQVANSGDGSRLHARTAPGTYRAMTALLLLLPGTPMLFQGQEFGSTAPFLYFADHRAELAAAVQKGRAEFVRQFRNLASPDMQARLAPPHDEATFERCRLDWSEWESRPAYVRLHRDLLALRRADAAFRSQQPGRVDGAVLTPVACVLRFGADPPEDERLLVVNLGGELREASFSIPLMAPPAGCRWEIAWSSEDPRYGGSGTPSLDDREWCVPGCAALVLKPLPILEHTDDRDDQS